MIKRANLLKSDSEEQFHLAPLVDILLLVVLLYAVTSSFTDSTQVIDLEQEVNRLTSEKQQLEAQILTQQEEILDKQGSLDAALETIRQSNLDYNQADTEEENFAQ